MAKITSAFRRDANRVPVTTDGIPTKKTITFLGGTTDAWGDDEGALDGGVMFTVTGAVRIRMFGICTTDLAGSGNHSVGITGAVTIFLPTEAAVDINVDDLVVNNATTADYFIFGDEAEAADNFPEYLLNGNDIIMTITGGANITSGVIDYYCIWTPFSSDGNVVDAGN
jgi:hypothetical protein